MATFNESIGLTEKRLISSRDTEDVRDEIRDGQSSDLNFPLICRIARLARGRFAVRQ